MWCVIKQKILAKTQDCRTLIFLSIFLTFLSSNIWCVYSIMNKTTYLQIIAFFFSPTQHSKIAEPGRGGMFFIVAVLTQTGNSAGRRMCPCFWNVDRKHQAVLRLRAPPEKTGLYIWEAYFKMTINAYVMLFAGWDTTLSLQRTLV